ncbi:MAG: hypothetical protein K0R09_1529 [Clostridiales bacterium]|jgi:flagellar hook-length control protein FliK|nr:hypothetical protein [Clostridiales bacterium]
MEISSLVSSLDLSSTLVKDMEKGQNMDGFSELFAMLFSNMLIPSSNPYSLLMNQATVCDSTSTSGNSIELTNILSAIDSLRISGGQLKDTENLQSFINPNSLLSGVLSNSTDFQKIFNLTDNIPEELQEFINNINGLSSKEGVNINRVDIISEQSGENITTSEAKVMLDILNIQAEENTPTIEPKKISDLLNGITTNTKADKISEETALNKNSSSNIGFSDNIKNIKSIIETNTNDTNNSANTQGEAKSLKPEEKNIKSLEPVINFEQASGLSNVKSENMSAVTLQDKVPEAALIENPQDIIDITVEKFKTLKLPGSTEVTVKLKPEELGEVSLKLVLEKGQINGSIIAERKEVVFMLQSNLEQLKTDLKNSNVNLNNITVNIQAGEEFDRNSGRKGFSNKQNRNNHRVAQAFEEEIQSYDLLEGLNIIA